MKAFWGDEMQPYEDYQMLTYDEKKSCCPLKTRWQFFLLVPYTLIQAFLAFIFLPFLLLFGGDVPACVFYCILLAGYLVFSVILLMKVFKLTPFSYQILVTGIMYSLCVFSCFLTFAHGRIYGMGQFKVRIFEEIIGSIKLILIFGVPNFIYFVKRKPLFIDGIFGDNPKKLTRMGAKSVLKYTFITFCVMVISILITAICLYSPYHFEDEVYWY